MIRSQRRLPARHPMRLFLKIVIGFQVLLGTWWTLPLLASDGDFSTLAVLFVSAAVNLAFYLIAAWVLWKRPAERRLAVIVFVLPIAMYFLPGLIKALAGGPLNGQQGAALALGLVTVLLGFGIFFPKRASQFLPAALLKSRLFNWLIIIALAIAWMLPILGTIWLATEEQGSGGSSSGMAIAYVIYFLALYIAAVGAASVCVMVFGWIALRSGIENTCRRLNITQIIMGTPSVALAVITGLWLVEQAA